jgi:hypothetical protein
MSVRHIQQQMIDSMVKPKPEPSGAVAAAEVISEAIAYHARRLGVGNAATEMGAIEALAAEVKRSGEGAQTALHEIASALDWDVSRSLDGIASALKKNAEANDRIAAALSRIADAMTAKQ